MGSSDSQPPAKSAVNAGSSSIGRLSLTNRTLEARGRGPVGLARGVQREQRVEEQERRAAGEQKAGRGRGAAQCRERGPGDREEDERRPRGGELAEPSEELGGVEGEGLVELAAV